MALCIDTNRPDWNAFRPLMSRKPGVKLSGEPITSLRVWYSNSCNTVKLAIRFGRLRILHEFIWVVNEKEHYPNFWQKIVKTFSYLTADECISIFKKVKLLYRTRMVKRVTLRKNTYTCPYALACVEKKHHSNMVWNDHDPVLYNVVAWASMTNYVSKKTIAC